MIIINEVILIYNISNKKSDILLSEWLLHKHVPQRLFLAKKNNKYSAIDNESNEFYIEEFDSKNKALFWLVRKDYSALEIGNMKDFQIKRLLDKENYKVIRFSEELQTEI